MRLPINRLFFRLLWSKKLKEIVNSAKLLRFWRQSTLTIHLCLNFGNLNTAVNRSGDKVFRMKNPTDFRNQALLLGVRQRHRIVNSLY